VVDAASYSTIILKKAASSSLTPAFKLASLTKGLKRDLQQQWFVGDESYASLVENHFVQVDRYPITGLTPNVDRASYSNIRRFINMKSHVPPDAVRLEEMLNYFNLDYEPPRNNQIFDINTVLTSCPWNPHSQLLFANIRSRKVSPESLPPTHFVFLIDISGSMDLPTRLPLLKAAFRGMVINLRSKDSVSIVVYGGSVGIALNTTGGDEKQKIYDVLDSLQAEGSTPGESGLRLAYSVARKHFIQGGNNRVILATDGDFNVGIKSEEELEELIRSQKESGIYLTCLGVGMGNYKDSKIQTLAQKGNGNYAYLDTYLEAEKVLLKEFMQTFYVIADDVYLNIEFKPEEIKEYRLLGFDNKAGAIKDSLASIEGGEISSGYSVLVAFEIVPHKNEDILQNSVSFSLQYKIPGQNKVNYLTQSPQLMYTSINELPQSYRFATALLMFGSLLRNSKFVKDKTWTEMYEIALASADASNKEQKEFIELVLHAKNLYTKKKKWSL
ncbi:MAG TPA: von Willebrand factor type A domain-containing protein, partial [Chitinophagaceae bacterium]